MRYLVIGANGLVGRAVAAFLDAAGLEWTGSCHSRVSAGLARLDVTDLEQLKAFVGSSGAGCVLNCANTAGGVDFCEANPDRARKFHVEAVMALGEACTDIGARLVFFSTDYVFPDQGHPVPESARPAPLNVYGRLKLEAESWLVSNAPQSLILRTTNVYGWDPETRTPNYVMGLWKALREGRRFSAPTYSWATPTYAADLAAAAICLHRSDRSGLFHVVGPDFLTRHAWAVLAAAELGLDASLIDAVGSPPEKMVPRPLKLRLDASKLAESGVAPMRGLGDGLAEMRRLSG